MKSSDCGGHEGQDKDATSQFKNAQDGRQEKARQGTARQEEARGKLRQGEDTSDLSVQTNRLND